MGSGSKSLVSIVIPTYNRQDLLRFALESCFHQTYEAIQVIVVDDGSTDGTVDYLRSLSPSHGEKLIWAVQPNLGPSAARNRGLELACGEFIKFLDSDDTLEKDAIEHFVGALEVHKADLCIGSKRFMSPEGRKWSIVYAPPDGVIADSINKFFDLELRPQTLVWCFHRQVFDNGVRWDERLLAREDTDLVSRILVQGATVAGASNAVVNQRYHSEGHQHERQFEKEVFQAILESNHRLYDLMVEHGKVIDAGRSFARSLSRTALRAWVTDREAAGMCYRLAKKAYPRPELVLLPTYPRWLRIAAYWLWEVGGLPLCGRLFELRSRLQARSRT